MFSSPNQKAWHEIYKQDTRLFYLPTWSKKEAKTMTTAMDLAEDVFEERWRKYKGIARALFTTDNQFDGYERAVDLSFENMNIKTAFDNLENPNAANQMKHMILYYEVDEDYLKARLQWGSIYLRDRAMEKYAAVISHDLADVLDDLSKCMSGSLKGQLLEPMALQLLCICAKPFQRILLSDGNDVTASDDLTFPELTMNNNLSDNEFMNALKNQTEENVLLVPSNPNYPAIDAAAFVTRSDGRRFCYLLQVTINRRHPVTGGVVVKRLQDVVEAVGGVENCALVFVLPDNNIFREFKAQKLIGNPNVTQCKIALSNLKRQRMYQPDSEQGDDTGRRGKK